MHADMAKTAAKWWADHLRNGAPLDNGDPSPTGGMAMIVGLMLQANRSKGRDPIVVDRFEEELSQHILKDEYTQRCGIHVDYSPGGTLQDAAERAGLELGMTDLPWKTNMWFRDGEISVAVGYGSPPSVLYP